MYEADLILNLSDLTTTSRVLYENIFGNRWKLSHSLPKSRLNLRFMTLERHYPWRKFPNLFRQHWNWIIWSIKSNYTSLLTMAGWRRSLKLENCSPKAHVSLRQCADMGKRMNALVQIFNGFVVIFPLTTLKMLPLTFMPTRALE